jgi:hypothetical protein
MDTTSLIAIVIAIAVIYFIFKFVVSPLIKFIAGIIALFLLIYILKNYLNIDVTQYLGQYGKFLDFTQWGIDFSKIQDVLKPIMDLVSKFVGIFTSK